MPSGYRPMFLMPILFPQLMSLERAVAVVMPMSFGLLCAHRTYEQAMSTSSNLPQLINEFAKDSAISVSSVTWKPRPVLDENEAKGAS